MIESSCVHPFIEHAQRIFRKGGGLGEVFKTIKPYQRKINSLVANVSTEAKIPHAIGMSAVGLGTLAIYEYARAKGLHLPDSGVIISGVLPVTSFSKDKEEAIDMPFATGVSKDGALDLDEAIYPRGDEGE